jgi:hypothetical protein
LIIDKKWAKNVKANERMAIIRHVNYRDRVKKKRSNLRVRGHLITPKTVGRWAKQARDEQWLGDASSPSRMLSNHCFRIGIMLTGPALPSCISLYTNSISSSPKATAAEPVLFQPAPTDRALRSILNYAQDQRIQLEAPDSGIIFNDLQTILSYLHSPNKNNCIGVLCYCDTKNRIIEEHVTRTRNIMNICHGIHLAREWEGM